MQREEQTHQKRLQKEEQLNALQEQMANQGDQREDDVSLDIDGMPDCRLKYQTIVKRAQRGMGKFTDSTFKADNSALGEDVAARRGSSV